jgi:hypothetical protein
VINARGKRFSQPRRTSNSTLLTGFIAGMLGVDGTYVPTETQPELVVQHSTTKNRYRIVVEQLSGVE